MYGGKMIVTERYKKMIEKIDTFIISAQETGDVVRVAHLKEVREKAKEIFNLRSKFMPGETQ
jgi:hypothetical protein